MRPEVRRALAGRMQREFAALPRAVVVACADGAARVSAEAGALRLRGLGLAGPVAEAGFPAVRGAATPEVAAVLVPREGPG